MNSGYGRDKYGIPAHRAAWIAANGPVPEGMVVGHVCHDEDDSCSGGPSCPHRRCVNVGHLAVMTYRENSLAARRNLSRSEQNRSRTYVTKETCHRGHFVAPERRKSGKGCPECKLIGARARYAKARQGNSG